uniref:Uncharacterized protein n=1 Tax=Tanacetum cinerariifolium TaxID=118510 RepID=A0A6L2JAC8_TANCI|nr:hypothetical protein [Tanacetum cinerariifolium]
MIINLKNMVGYKMKHFRAMTCDKVRQIFKREYKKFQTLFRLDKDVEEPQKKRVSEETLLQETFKKLKAVAVSSSVSTQETLTIDPKEMNWEIHSEGSRSYWKILELVRINAAGLSLTTAGSRLMLLSKADTAAEETEEITLSS